MRRFLVTTKFESGIGVWVVVKGIKKAEQKLKELETKYPRNINLLTEIY